MSTHRAYYWVLSSPDPAILKRLTQATRDCTQRAVLRRAPRRKEEQPAETELTIDAPRMYAQEACMTPKVLLPYTATPKAYQADTPHE